MHRWAACPGSVKLSENIPNVSSKYAEEGTEAHELAAYVLMNSKWPECYAEKYSDEMMEHVQTYCQAFFHDAQNCSWYKVEERFDLTNLHPALFGTSDGIIYHAKESLLQVWDFKYGAGIPVEVEDNEQLKYYALGALMKTKVPCKTVELVICQPRCPHPEGPIRRWRLSVVDLIEFSAELVDFARATEKEDAPLVPGDHCRFCPAAPTCHKLQETAVTAAQEEFSPVYSYDPAKLKKTLDILPAIEAWVKSVKEFAFNEAQHGRVAPGYKLVATRPSRKWRDEEEAQKAILELGIDFTESHKPASLKSPAQIEGLLSKDQKKKIAELIVKESSGTKLVPYDDKREPAKPDAIAEFTKVEDVTSLFE